METDKAKIIQKRGSEGALMFEGGRRTTDDLAVDLAHMLLDPLNTKVIGSSGVNPGPESNVIGLLSSIVVSVAVEVYRVMRPWSAIPSTAAMQRLSDLTVRGNANCSMQMRPR